MFFDAPTRSELKSRILTFIDDPLGGDFDVLALDLFRRLWRDNSAYRGICMARGMDPQAVQRVIDIPAVSTTAFKRLVFSTAPAARVFRTSGTTHGSRRRGAHHMVELDLYRAALRSQFKRFVLPDRERMRLLILASSPDDVPDSSLSFMLGDVLATFGEPGSDFFLAMDRLDGRCFVEALQAVREAGEPVALLGTLLGLVHAMDFLKRSDLQFELPAGSRIMDTGGSKGRFRDVSRHDLIEMSATRLGIAPDHVVNEYGMTELSSQFYDGALIGEDPDTKLGPHWVHTSVIDPETGLEMSPGRPGLLRHVDLANLDSVAFVETEDLGMMKGAGFVLLGRESGAEPRGCSLAAADSHGEWP